MSTSDTFERILMSLRDAVLDDAQWPAASALIDKACGAKGNELVVGEDVGGDARVLFAGFYRHGERRHDLERTYFDAYYPWDERVPRLRQLRDGHVVHVRDLYSDEELKTSPTYNEELPRSGTQNGLNVRLDGPDGSRIVWSLADPVEPGGWGTAQTRMVENLLPHIRQFVQVRSAMAGGDALGVSLTSLLDNTRIGVIYLDRRGRVTEANDSARSILRRADGLLNRGGFLCTRQPADNARLERLLGEALPRWDDAATGNSMAVRRAPALPPLEVHITPVSTRQMDFGLRDVAALILVVDPASRPRLDAGLVAEILGLTLAESQVAIMLAEGKTIGDVAAASNRQVSTVKVLTQRAYRKLGISRQVDLVRLVLSLPDVSPRR